jgi:hypothetical protein
MDVEAQSLVSPVPTSKPFLQAHPRTGRIGSRPATDGGLDGMWPASDNGAVVLTDHRRYLGGSVSGAELDRSGDDVDKGIGTQHGKGHWLANGIAEHQALQCLSADHRFAVSTEQQVAGA